jgi:hypothetical protein
MVLRFPIISPKVGGPATAVALRAAFVFGAGFPTPPKPPAGGLRDLHKQSQFRANEANCWDGRAWKAWDRHAEYHKPVPALARTKPIL